MKEAPKKDWLIDGVLPANSRAILYADSGVGKSFTTLDMSLHVATGLPWQGHTVKQGPVYYLAAENEELMRERVQAWEKLHKGGKRFEKSHPGTHPPFVVFPGVVDLSSPEAMDALLARLGPASLVVIDTLLAAMGALNVKESSESQAAITQVNRITAKTGATVMLVHHTPEQGNNPLGGAVWRGGLPTRIYLTRQRNGKNLGEDADFQDDDTLTLTCKKQSGSLQFPDIVVPVRLVKLARDLTVPVLASEPKPLMDFATAQAQYGDDRAKIAAATGMKPAAVRQRFSRLKLVS